MHRQVQTALVACFMILGFLGTALAQDRGTIEGTITDASGAVVPAAKVQIVQLGTNASWDFEANEVGRYFAPNLPLGDYRVTVQKAGFNTATSRTIEIRSQTSARADMKLQVGQVEQSIEVSSQAEMIDASTTTNTSSLSTKFIDELPLLSFGKKADISNYLQYLPGSEATSMGSSIAPVINGSQTFAAEVFLDGAPASDGVFRGSMVGNGGAVNHYGEFNIVTNSFSAEYGRTGTWFYSVSVKSGTNDLHGSLYYNFFNNVLNAREFFQAQRAIVRQNNGGYTLGGPVYIPKLYNGRNRTFFFFGHDMFYSTGTQAGNLLTIPTLAMRQGDFSNYRDAGGNVVPIFDPASTDALNNRTQFPGNRIDSARFSAISKSIIALMPSPDLPSQDLNWHNRTGASFGNFPSDPLHNNFSITSKVDHSFTNNHKISVSYSDEYRPRKIAGSGWGLDNPLEGLQLQPLHSRTARFSYDAILRPTLINHITLGYDRYLNPAFAATAGEGWNAKLGIRGFPFDIGAFPSIGFSGGTSSPLGMGTGQYSNLGTARWSFNDSISWIKANHFLKFGVNIWFEARNDNAKAGASGQWGFTNSVTSQPNAPQYVQWGSSFASFLLGAAGSASTNGPTYLSTRLPYQAVFVQDEWHAMPKLTLSLGLRWENNSPPYDKYDRFANFSPTVPNPAAGNILGAVVFAGSGPGTINARTTVKPWHKGFSPRFGVAYQFTPKLVARASFGILYAPPAMNALTLQGYSSRASVPSPDGFTPAMNWQNPFPSFQTSVVIDPTVLNAQVINWYEPEYVRSGQILSVTLGFQYQVSQNTMLDVTYLGNHGTHLETDYLGNPNTLNPSYLSLGSLLNQRIDSPAAIAAGIKSPWPGFASFALPTVGQALRPYPQFSDVTNLRSKVGVNKYNSLQLKLTKRFSGGLTVLSSFSWSKNLTNTPFLSPAPTFAFGFASQNPYNRGGEVSPSEYTLPADFKFTVSYDLPFGKGKRMLSNSGSIVNALLGGWQVVFHLSRASGNALTVSSNNNLSLFGYGNKRANVVAGKPLTLVTSTRDFDPARDRYINPDAFVTSGQFALGNTPRTMDWMRGFPNSNEAGAISKNLSLYQERVKLRLGADFNNPFNIVRWNNPISNRDSGLFGRVTSVKPARQIQLTAQITF